MIFVHGCFWHRHPECKKTSTPTANREFWADKFERNVERDGRKILELERLGWRVIVVWECELKGDGQALVSRLRRMIMSVGAA